MSEPSPVESETIFGQLLVERGLARPEHVEECLGFIRRSAADGVQPLPKLVSLLHHKGYLTLEQYQETLRATPPGSSGTALSAPGSLPAEVIRALEIRDNAVGKYVKVSRLGAGGMGEVWRAWD